jgi:aspartate/tyrosine/aromatic aminotransferase
VASVQTLSGTGALSLGALLLSRFLQASDTNKVYVSDPPYVNHVPIMRQAGLEIDLYPYYDAKTRLIDFSSLREKLTNIPDGSTILLHVCAHNPTGTHLSAEQWKEVAQIMKTKDHLPFFDSAYQGFASGDSEATIGQYGTSLNSALISSWSHSLMRRTLGSTESVRAVFMSSLRPQPWRVTFSASSDPCNG